MDASECSTKRCSDCGIEKPATTDFFYRDPRYSHGVGGICKPCCRLRRRRYCKANREKINTYRRKVYWDDPDAARAKMRKQAAKPADRERERLYRLAYAKSHRAAYNARQRRRRARHAACEGSHTAADVAAVYEQQNGLCAYCETELGGSFHVDHVVPLSKGGTDWPDNLAVACATCNLTKNDDDLLTFVRKLGYGVVID